MGACLWLVTVLQPEEAGTGNVGARSKDLNPGRVYAFSFKLRPQTF